MRLSQKRDVQSTETMAMALATVSGSNHPSRLRLRRAQRTSHALEATLLLAFVMAAVGFFGQGGAEALAGMSIGALVTSLRASRRRLQSAFSGAFAGLFISLMVAGFFHDALMRALG
jgi:hypothetical protein